MVDSGRPTYRPPSRGNTNVSYTPSQSLSRQERVELVSTLATAGFVSGGLMFGLVAEQGGDDAAGYVLIPIGTGITALAVSASLVANDRVSRGQATLLTEGVYWGYLLGLGLAGSGLMGGRSCSGTTCGMPGFQTTGTTVLVTSTLTLTSLGILGARHPDVDPDHISTVTIPGGWGAVGGIFLSMMTTPDGDSDTWALGLGGALVGFGTGGLLLAFGPELDQDRLRLMSLGSMVGVLGGLVFVAFNQTSEAPAFGALMLIGEALGLAITARLTRPSRRRDRYRNRYYYGFNAAPTTVVSPEGRVVPGLGLGLSF